MSAGTMTSEAIKIPEAGSDSPKRPKKSLWTGGVVSGALWGSIKKLNPRTLMKNPVMFVVEVGAVVTTVDLLREIPHHSNEFGFALQITLWLWFTVLFANFAEAMAEGRGKAQAETLRKTKSDSLAKKILPNGQTESVTSSKLRAGDIVICEANETIPGDGDVID